MYQRCARSLVPVGKKILRNFSIGKIRSVILKGSTPLAPSP
jgi:hypothetical protein